MDEGFQMKIRVGLLGHMIAFGVALSQIPLVRAEVSNFACGPIANAFGPYDYRSHKEDLPVVEAHHFTPEVENLVRGNSRHPGSTIGGDLSYTLRAYPNHPRALMAMVRLGARENRDKPRDAMYTVECFLFRAWRFQSDDPAVRMIYATYLATHGRPKEALKHLEDAQAMGEDSPNFQYNLGLIYFDLKEYDKSLTYAYQAYANGFSLPGLREKLKKAGKWKEPETPVETNSPAD
jgi:tetratricopeptide (TPR) repeat protein